MLDQLLLPLQFIQQHGIQNLIFHGFHLAVSGVSDEIGINVVYFLGDQAVLDRLRADLEGPFMAERDGTETEERAARVSHRLDVSLIKALRRADRA